MAAPELLTDRCKILLEEIAKNEGFTKYELIVKKGFTLGENYSGDIFKVVITGEKEDIEQASLYLIMKVSLKLPSARENNLIRDIYKREAYVYSKMLPILDECQKNLTEAERFTYAKLYAAVIEDDDEIIVLEDLCPKGYTMLDRKEPLSYEQLVVCITTLARFHATSMVLRVQQPKVYEEIDANTSNHESLTKSLGKFVASNVSTIRDIIKNETYEEGISRILDNIEDEFVQLFHTEVTNPYSVLVHGDSWINNLMFLNKDGNIEKMIMVDWQLVRNASPLIDLSYVLILSTDAQTRAKHYEEILDLYYETLSSNVTKLGLDISKCFPKSIYREQVKTHMKFALMLAFPGLPLILADKKDAISHSDMFDTFNDKNVPLNTVVSETCRKRFHELFEDCLRFNII